MRNVAGTHGGYGTGLVDEVEASGHVARVVRKALKYRLLESPGDMTTNGITAQSEAGNSLHALVGKFLPFSPADLLLLGELPDAWADALETQGYGVTGLRWRDQGEYAQHPGGTRSGLLRVNLALAETAGRHFDAALIMDFTPMVHPLALFDQLDDLLKKDGMVFLLGENTHRMARLAHWLDYAVSIGNRCGFVLLQSYPEAPASDSPIFVHILRKSGTPRWRISHVLPKDFPEVSALFHEVFGHPMSRELWQWKYGEGRGNAVVARKEGNVVAHYGGMYRDILLCGQPDWAFQICDVMVHAKERGVLTRQGPFFLAAATCAEIYGPLGYGFPNQRAMRVAEKMGLYSEVGQMAEVRWEAASPRFRWRTRVRNIFPQNASDQALVNRLWDGMARDLRHGVVGVRNWEYLEQRYFRHPNIHYEVLVVSGRLTGAPLGIVVLRRHEGACELLDVIAPLSSLAPVIDQARRMTGRWGLPYLYCWITKNHLQLFLDCAGKEEALDISIPTSCWTADPRADSFKDKWWLMSGDTDFH